MNDEAGILQFRHREYTRSHPRQHLYYIAVIHFTRERRESVWRKSSYLIKNFKN